MMKMVANRNIKFYIGVFTLLLIISCRKNVSKDNIVGQWAIEDVKFQNKSYKEQLYSNVLIFENDGKVSIPESTHFTKDRNSYWEFVDDDKNKLKISTSNKVFNDTFKISFINNDSLKLRGIKLTSDKIEIQAYKLLQNYDSW